MNTNRNNNNEDIRRLRESIEMSLEMLNCNNDDIIRGPEMFKAINENIIFLIKKLYNVSNVDADIIYHENNYKIKLTISHIFNDIHTMEKFLIHSDES